MLVISAEQCNGPCGRQVSPISLFSVGDARICWDCYHWHLQALALLTSGQPPKGCQECGRSYAQLERESSVQARMFLHPKDGVYAVLCQSCSDLYEALQRQRYIGTRYGQQKRLVN